ncbi:LAFE_0D09142g1_1 [Lachancea fermentati]|uniref:Transcription and mRNA export factor SUS1 n=1 Tax=Lachancea fermentati TaxID=4955 RepID=A0A1G4MBP0_LACFM|nr:LAFE_0D09142g1_1 [Lachancea fermentati]
MTSSDSRSLELKAQIQQYLVQSGNYEIISSKLTQMLLEDGWMDEVKRLTNEEIKSNDSTNFTQILAKVEPQALEMVSDSTRNNVINQIRQFLGEIVDTE